MTKKAHFEKKIKKTFDFDLTSFRQSVRIQNSQTAKEKKGEEMTDKEKKTSTLYVRTSDNAKDLLKKVIEIKSSECGTRVTAGQALEMVLTDTVRKVM